MGFLRRPKADPFFISSVENSTLVNIGVFVTPAPVGSPLGFLRSGPLDVLVVLLLPVPMPSSFLTLIPFMPIVVIAIIVSMRVLRQHGHRYRRGRSE